jgi:hypothetical protein
MASREPIAPAVQTLRDDDEDGAAAWIDPPPVFVHVTCDHASEAPEPSPIDAMVGGVVLLWMLAPHATSVWNDRVFPALSWAWQGIAGTGGADGAPAATDEPATVIGPAPADPSRDVAVALEEHVAGVDSAGAQEPSSQLLWRD